MSHRLQNKRCLVIGGTGGIGLPAVKHFHKEGAKLVMVGQEQADVDAAASATVGLGDCYAMAADATDATAVERLFTDAIARLGGLDVLYHVAGISGRRYGDGPLHECTDAGWRKTLEANLTSVFLTNRSAVRYFLKENVGGAILNMASVLAYSPAPRYFDTIAYATSKGGIIAMSRQIAAHYASQRIRVNVLALGLIDTPMAARAVHDPGIQAYLQSKQPLCQGPGNPDDCSQAAVFLCSDEARLITGVVLPIDGAWGISEGQWTNEERRA